MVLALAVTIPGSAFAETQFHGGAVADLAALKAILPGDRFDKQERTVEGPPLEQYFFDLQSAAGSNEPDVAVPDDSPATGRWFRLIPSGGVPASHEPSHNENGSDELFVENLGAISVVTTDALMPDGAGGLVFGSPAPAAHLLGGAQHTADTLANLNSKVSDAVLIDTGDARLSDARTPLAHIHAAGDLPVEVAYENEANIFLVRQTFNGSIQLFDEDATPVASRRLRVIDGLFRSADLSDVEGRHIAKTSLELITNAEVDAGAAIAESKLALNFATADPALKINRDGTQTLTGNWNTGAFSILPGALQARPAGVLPLRDNAGVTIFTIGTNATISQVAGADPSDTSTALDSRKLALETRLWSGAVAVTRTITIRAEGITGANQSHSLSFSSDFDGGDDNFFTVQPSSGQTIFNTPGVVATWGSLLQLNAGLFILDDKLSDMGSGSDFRWVYETVNQTNNTLLWGTQGSEGNTVVFTHKSRLTLDHVVGTPSTPTMRWHDGSVTAGNYGSVTHDGTNLSIVVNAGALEVTGDVIPEADNTRSSGGSGARWASVWLVQLRNAAGQFAATLATGATIFNDAGIDIDFVAESDNDPVAFTVDAGLNRVGVGVALGGHLAKFHVQQDAAVAAFFIDQNGNGSSIVLDIESTTAHVIDFGTTPLTTSGNLIECNTANALTTGGFMNFRSASTAANVRTLVMFVNSNSNAVGCEVLHLEQRAAKHLQTWDVATLDIGFIDFVASADADATSAISTLTTSGAVQGHVQIEINGTKRWFAFLADPS